MQRPAPPSVRPHPPGPPTEVERARALYLHLLRARVRDGSYFTPERVETAFRRMLAAIRESLPDEREDAEA